MGGADEIDPRPLVFGPALQFWGARLYEVRSSSHPSVFLEYQDRRRAGHLPCVLSRSGGEGRFAVAPSCLEGALFIAKQPQERRYYFEKTIGGHSGMDPENLCGLWTRPYFDSDLTFEKNGCVFVPMEARPCENKCLVDALRLVSEFMAACYNVRIDRSSGDFTDLMVSSAFTAGKVSFHIVCNYCIQDRFAFKHHLKCFMESLPWDTTIDADIAPMVEHKISDWRITAKLQEPPII